MNYRPMEDTGNYVLVRHGNKVLYVAKPGNSCSYTTNLQEARRFPNEEIARRNACGNESVLKVAY